MKKNMTVIAFGDSITQATNAIPEPYKRWPNLLERKLTAAFPGTRWNVINAGVGGESDREKMARFESQVRAHKPNILLLQFGGNNSGYRQPHKKTEPEETRAFMERVRAELPADTEILVITMPPIYEDRHLFGRTPAGRSFFARWGGIDAFAERFRETTRAFARDHGYPVADLSAAIRESEAPQRYTLPDGIHLNEAGNRLLAELVFKTLTSAAAQSS